MFQKLMITSFFQLEEWEAVDKEQLRKDLQVSNQLKVYPILW